MAKVIVLRPVLDAIEPATQDSLNTLKSYTMNHTNHIFMPNAWQDIFVTGGPFLHHVRNDCIDRAGDPKCGDWTHALFVDDDMIFPQDALEKLLEADKDVVGVQYVMRSEPHYMNVWMPRGGTHLEQLRTPLWYDGVHEVGAVPMGLTLIKRTVLEAMGGDWFSFREQRGEDMQFCVDARARGFTVWVHCDIPVKHIGKLAYDLEFVERRATGAAAWLEDRLKEINSGTAPVSLEGEIPIER